MTSWFPTETALHTSTDVPQEFTLLHFVQVPCHALITCWPFPVKPHFTKTGHEEQMQPWLKKQAQPVGAPDFQRNLAAVSHLHWMNWPPLCYIIKNNFFARIVSDF